MMLNHADRKKQQLHYQNLRNKLRRMEAEYCRTFDDFSPEDTLVSYFRRKGMRSAARHFEVMYREVGWYA